MHNVGFLITRLKCSLVRTFFVYCLCCYASSMLHCVNRNALRPKHLPKRITKIDLCASCVHYLKPKMNTRVSMFNIKRATFLNSYTYVHKNPIIVVRFGKYLCVRFGLSTDPFLHSGCFCFGLRRHDETARIKDSVKNLLPGNRRDSAWNFFCPARVNGKANLQLG